MTIEELQEQNETLRRQLAAARIKSMLEVKQGMEDVAESLLSVGCDGVDPLNPDEVKARAGELATKNAAVFTASVTLPGAPGGVNASMSARLKELRAKGIL